MSAPQVRRKCPWCGAPMVTGTEYAMWLPFHLEPAERWAVKGPECVASGVRIDDAEALAAIRDEHGGRAFRLRAHP